MYIHNPYHVIKNVEFLKSSCDFMNPVQECRVAGSETDLVVTMDLQLKVSEPWCYEKFK